jgi:hypothetical protein
MEGMTILRTSSDNLPTILRQNRLSKNSVEWTNRNRKTFYMTNIN